MPNLFASRTLKTADWNNSRLVKSDIAEEIERLEQQPGKDQALFGSARLMSTLMKLNLIDEYRVTVNPVVLGRGTALFQGVDERLDLKLVSARPFTSGNVLLTYQPA